MNALATLHGEASRELQHILNYWTDRTVDHERGGFIGRIRHDGISDPLAPKGSVLNSRILWTFAAAFRHTGDPRHLDTATRAFQYIHRYFVDGECGGVYWTVDYAGRPAEMKKQVYAQAFCLYGCAEFHHAAGDEGAKRLAIELYNLIENHSHDPVNGGYLEAFTRDWSELGDLRLSEKDANEKKTMNTHLHVLEAYSCLYRIWPDAGLAARIRSLLDIFRHRIINPQNGHLDLFFDADWKVKGDHISYGHDIKAGWLMLEAAECIGDQEYIASMQVLAESLTRAAMQGLDTDGGLWYEYLPASGELIREKHWWPQAEAVVGLVNAWQVSNHQAYLDAALRCWKFIRQHIIDHQEGEWFWGIGSDGLPMAEDKVGLWKCPYHNGRACLEIMRRLG